jgi:hypothetical protein
MQALFIVVALTLIAATLGAFLTIFPRLWNHQSTPKTLKRWLDALRTDEQGGYVHDTAMSQYIPPTAMHYVTGTWTQAAGAVAGTIAMHRAANAGGETAVVTVPITLPSNSVAQKGAYLKTIEFDYENLAAAMTSITAALKKVTRGADTAVAVVSAVTITQDLAAAVAAATQDQHKMTVTLTTPAWIDNDEYYLLQMSMVAPAVATTDVLAAVANFTLRL